MTPPSLDPLTPVLELIQLLERQYREKYGTALFDVRAGLDPSGRHLHLAGEVLLSKQKSELISQIRKRVSLPVTDSIRVLAERGREEGPPPDEGFWRSLDWLKPSLVSGPASEWGKAKEGEVLNVYRSTELKQLSTQVNSFDSPFWILKKLDSVCLIKLEDGTVGWVRTERIQEWPTVNTGSGKPPVLPARIALVEGKTVPVRKETLDRILSEAEKFVDDTPYLWGGRSKEGVDCSGLIQLVFLFGANLLLPKNTRDQMRIGVDRPVEELKPGDLLFARVKNKSIWHVAIRMDGPGYGLVHASLQRKKVIRDSLESFSESYHHLFGKSVLDVTD